VRRETFIVPGGTDGVRLISETAEDGSYTRVELALLEAMLKWEPPGTALPGQMRRARIVERTLTGHGVWIVLQSLEPWDMEAPRGRAAIDSVFYTPGDDSGLFAFAQFDGADRAIVDICAVDGESHGCDDCERILFGDPDRLTFHPYWPASDGSGTSPA
jgi:hypothetical protein